MANGEALDVDLVDQARLEARAWAAVVTPVEGRIDDHAARQVRGGVVIVDGQVGRLVAERVAEQPVPDLDRAVDPARVRVEEQLARVEAMAGGGVVRPGRPQAVALPGA